MQICIIFIVLGSRKNLKPLPKNTDLCSHFVRADSGVRGNAVISNVEVAVVPKSTNAVKCLLRTTHISNSEGGLILSLVNKSINSFCHRWCVAHCFL